MLGEFGRVRSVQGRDKTKLKKKCLRVRDETEKKWSGEWSPNQGQSQVQQDYTQTHTQTSAFMLDDPVLAWLPASPQPSTPPLPNPPGWWQTDNSRNKFIASLPLSPPSPRPRNGSAKQTGQQQIQLNWISPFHLFQGFLPRAKQATCSQQGGGLSLSAGHSHFHFPDFPFVFCCKAEIKSPLLKTWTKWQQRFFHTDH